MESTQAMQRLKIEEPGPAARWGFLIGSLAVAAVPTFVLYRLWSPNGFNLTWALILVVFALVFYGVAFLMLWVAMSKHSIAVDASEGSITTGTRTLFKPVTRYKTYRRENVDDLVIKSGEKSAFSVNVLLKDGQQDLLMSFASKVEAQAFTEKAASILWPEEAGRLAARSEEVPSEMDSGSKHDLIIAEGNLIAGLLGFVVITCLGLLFLYFGFSKDLPFLAIPAAANGLLALGVLSQAFNKKIILFDTGKKTVIINMRSLLHMSGIKETYRWDEIKEIVSEKVDMGKSVAYGVFLILPKLQPKTLVKYYGDEKKAEEMRIRIAALIQKGTENTDGA